MSVESAQTARWIAHVLTYDSLSTDDEMVALFVSNGQTLREAVRTMQGRVQSERARRVTARRALEPARGKRVPESSAHYGAGAEEIA